MTAPVPRAALLVVAALLAAFGVVAATGGMAEPVAARPTVDQHAYGAGWAAAVAFQTSQPSPPTDDLTRAQCRWRFDGINPPDRREYRAAYLAGCDDMTLRTDLEKRR